MIPNPLEKVIEMAGSQAQLAERVNELVSDDKHIGQQHVSYWLREGVPIKWVDVVSEVSGGKVTPKALAEWKILHKMASRFKRGVAHQ